MCVELKYSYVSNKLSTEKSPFPQYQELKNKSSKYFFKLILVTIQK